MPGSYQGGPSYQGGGSFQVDSIAEAPSVASSFRVFIAGVDRTETIRRIQDIDCTYTFGSRGVLRFQTIEKRALTSAAYRPTIDQSIEMLYLGTTVFYGSIVGVEDKLLGERYTVTEVEAVDRSRALDQRLINFSYLGETHTLKSLVQSIEPAYLTPIGIMVDSTMPDGPVMPAGNFDRATLNTIFATWAAISGYVHRVTPVGLLQWFNPGWSHLPYTLSAANANVRHGATWSKTRTKLVTRQYVRAGTPGLKEKTQDFVSGGNQEYFTLDYPAAGINLRGYITVNGNFIPLGNPPWTWDAPSNSVRYTAPGAPGGTAVSITYDANFPVTVFAEDAGMIADPSIGVWEDIVDAPDVFEKATAQAYADGLLRRYRVEPRTLILGITEDDPQPLPGDTVTIILPDRTVIGDWLITAVTFRDEPYQQLRYEITCLEGTEAHGSWIDYFKRAFGGGATGTSYSSISGSALPPTTGLFYGDVSAHSGLPGKQVLATNVIGTSTNGAGIWYGRPQDATSWWAVADHTEYSPAQPRLRLACPNSLGTAKFHAQFYIPNGITGVSYLTGDGAGSGVLALGGPQSIFGDDAHRVILHSSSADALLGYTERGRTTKVGDRLATAYSAGYFSADTGSHWTVAPSSDQSELASSLIGKQMTLVFEITASSISNTPAYLKIAIPGSYTIAALAGNALRFATSNGLMVHGMAVAFAGETFIRIYRNNLVGAASGTTLWSNGTDNCDVRGQITFWIT